MFKGFPIWKMVTTLFHVVSSDLPPYMVWWNHATRSTTLLELTVPFGTLMDDATIRKMAKYVDLSKEAAYMQPHCNWGWIKWPS